MTRSAVVCRWHDGIITADDAILVAAIERGSGPPLALYACHACAAERHLLPLDEHPDDSDGDTRHRDEPHPGVTP